MQTSERSLMRTSPEANPEANAKANPRGTLRQTTWRAPSKQNPGTNSEAIKKARCKPQCYWVYATESCGFSSTN